MSRSPRIYVSGPMTGHYKFNFPAFEAAAAMLRGKGWMVLNPADNFDGDTTLPYRDYVDADLALLGHADALYVLAGWDGADARGSVWEHAIATTVMRLPAYYEGGEPVPWASDFDLNRPGLNFTLTTNPAPRLTTTRAPEPSGSVLIEAEGLVDGARQQDYGHPADDFTRTGRMWGAILNLPRDVSAAEVAMCMVAVKLSREVNRPKRDNRVDMAGYTKTLDMVREYQSAESE